VAGRGWGDGPSAEDPPDPAGSSLKPPQVATRVRLANGSRVAQPVAGWCGERRASPLTFAAGTDLLRPAGMNTQRGRQPSLQRLEDAQEQLSQREADGARDRQPTSFPIGRCRCSKPKLIDKLGLGETEPPADGALLHCLAKVTHHWFLWVWYDRVDPESLPFRDPGDGKSYSVSSYNR
jgi:hypothetical protein